MTYRAILFDLDGTLRHNEPNGFETFLTYLSELGFTPSAEQRAHGERWTHYYWSIAPELQTDIEELGADTAEFWTRYSERQIRALNLSGDADLLALQVNERFNARYHPENRVPEDVHPTLSQLRRAGYTLGLVSNRLTPLDAIAAELGLADLFHFTLSAGQAGAWKPAPEIFHQAVALADCGPSQAIYVGDNFYADIEGARGAGLTPVLVDPRGLFPEPGCTVIHAIGELPACGLLPRDIEAQDLR
jgi:HAD superfamily hydrolase (TIGR01549 family)